MTNEIAASILTAKPYAYYRVGWVGFLRSQWTITFEGTDVIIMNGSRSEVKMVVHWLNAAWSLGCCSGYTVGIHERNPNDC